MTGFLNIDKPVGKSSAYIVGGVKRLTRTPCGHLGTLDPNASGVLPVGLGNATRLFDYFLSKQKTYRARFTFGATTDTLDGEGEVHFGGEIPTEQEIQGALSGFVGKILQVPPKYSAKSVEGVRGYRLARRGKEFELPPKEVEVYRFDYLRQTAPAEFEFEICCGAGTYIRALARDLAERLGTLGYTSYLRRTASGIFTEETAIPPEKLTPENWQNYLIPTDMVLPFPVIDTFDARIFNGVTVPTEAGDGLYKIYRDGAFYGLARAEGGMLKAEKKLC